MIKEIKAVFCGDSLVGKTSILKRFFDDEFDQNVIATVGGVFTKKYIENKEIFELHIWDTAGSDRYNTLVPSFFHNAGVVIIVFDVTDKETYEHLIKWVQIARDSAPKDVPFIIVGNKVDLYDKREVQSETALAFAKEIQALNFVETSAKTGEGVNLLFSHITSVQTYIASHTNTIAPRDLKQITDEKKCC